MASGDRIHERVIGFSWYSPAGASLGSVNNRRIYLTGLRREQILARAGTFAFAQTVELVPLTLVERTRGYTERCVPDKTIQGGKRCVFDSSKRIAVGAGVSPLGMRLYLDRWRLDGRAVLIGDAAHAMVPFHGQGMNCAFEDCVALADHLERNASLADAFAAFEAQRKPDAEAIQRMALENYIEMRDKVDDAGYLLQRQLELALQERHPGRFVPHYAMVSFMRIPYSVALQRSEVQKTILEDATRGISSLDEVDWAAADSAVLAKLQPLM